MEPPSTTDVQDDQRVAHPLAPLTADEIRQARAVVEKAGKVTEAVRFPLITLLEPAKAEVLSHRPGAEVSRRVLLIVLDLATGDTHEGVVSLTSDELEEWVQVPTAAPPYGQAPIMLEEFELVEQIVRADPGWREAIAKRGVDDLESVFVAPLSPGQFGHEEEAGRRILRSLSFLRDHATDSPWAHPVEGLIAHVDIIKKKVIKLIDTGVVPVPTEQGNFDEAHVGPPRTTLKPLEIIQPEGPSFSVEGNEVTWQNWKLRVTLDPREGLVLHTVSFTDGERERPIIYRASIAEMVVPYGDPSPTRFWISYFDSGEYLLGKQANSLELGCDCLGEIYYFDAVLADDEGEPYTLRNAICMHEEDYGILWKHTDTTGGGIAETRRSRRLVVSFFATIGNYDYGFFWYLYLDGTIQMEAKLTGIVFTAGLEPGTEWEHGVELAPGLGAPNHQHLFSARLDMMVDGVQNSVQEIDVEPLPVGENNPYGNAWRTKATTIRSESEGARTADVQAARTWKVINRGLAEPDGQAGRLQAGHPAHGHAAERARLIGGQPGGVRHQAPLGHPVRPRAALPGGQLPESALGWRRDPGVDQGRPPAGQRGRRAVAHLRRHSRRAHRGLAGDAGRVRGLHAQAGQLLRPQPRAGPAPQRQCARQHWQLPLATQHGMVPPTEPRQMGPARPTCSFSAWAGRVRTGSTTVQGLSKNTRRNGAKAAARMSSSADNAQVALLCPGELGPLNQRVVGSIPTRRTGFRRPHSCWPAERALSRDRTTGLVSGNPERGAAADGLLRGTSFSVSQHALRGVDVHDLGPAAMRSPYGPDPGPPTPRGSAPC